VVLVIIIGSCSSCTFRMRSMFRRAPIRRIPSRQPSLTNQPTRSPLTDSAQGDSPGHQHEDLATHEQPEPSRIIPQRFRHPPPEALLLIREETLPPYDPSHVPSYSPWSPAAAETVPVTEIEGDDHSEARLMAPPISRYSLPSISDRQTQTTSSMAAESSSPTSTISIPPEAHFNPWT
jgi:hypothetical protein